MAGDDRDPTACSLLYFALGKVKLVHGLWKQAAWHPERQVMLKFLSNDFENPHWRTAALKNAFALMSKQRFGMPAFPASTFWNILRTIKLTRICCRFLRARRVSEGRSKRVHQSPTRLPIGHCTSKNHRRRGRWTRSQRYFSEYCVTYRVPGWESMACELVFLGIA